MVPWQLALNRPRSRHSCECPFLAISSHPIIQFNNIACKLYGRWRHNDSPFWLRAGNRRIQPARPVLDLPGLQALFGQLSPGRGQHGKRGDGMEGVGVHAVDIQMVQQPGQGPVRVRAVDQAKFVSGRDHTRLQHAVIPAGAGAGLNAPGHVRDAEAHAEFPAGLAGLGDLDARGAETELVAHADALLGEADGGDVLAERAGAEAFRQVGKLAAPGRVMLEREMVHGLVRPAMAAGIALLVAGETRHGQPQGRGDRLFVDGAGFAVRPEGARLADQKVYGGVR